jgi:hypothetical protein
MTGVTAMTEATTITGATATIEAMDMIEVTAMTEGIIMGSSGRIRCNLSSSSLRGSLKAVAGEDRPTPAGSRRGSPMGNLMGSRKDNLMDPGLMYSNL